MDLVTVALPSEPQITYRSIMSVDSEANDQMRLPDASLDREILTQSRIVAALSGACRHHGETKVNEIAAILREDQLRQPPAIQGAHEAVVSGGVAIIAALNPN